MPWWYFLRISDEAVIISYYYNTDKLSHDDGWFSFGAAGNLRASLLLLSYYKEVPLDEFIVGGLEWSLISWPMTAGGTMKVKQLMMIFI